MKTTHHFNETIIYFYFLKEYSSISGSNSMISRVILPFKKIKRLNHAVF